MTHPSSSYLPPSTVDLALDLARRLHRAADAIGRLADGGAGGPPGLYGGGAPGSGGRIAARAIAVEHWVGPHRNAFEPMFAEEMASVRTAEQRLRSEAEAWAAFWAAAGNARQDRLHDEAMARHRLAPDGRPPPPGEHVSVPSAAHDSRPAS